MKHIIIFLFLITTAAVHAQGIDLFCVAGDTTSLTISFQIDDPANHTVSGNIIINNPTVAYLDSVHINSAKLNIVRIKPDSIEIPVQAIGDNTSYTMKFFLKALAGNDSLTDIYIKNLFINDKKINTITVKFHNIPLGGSVPYLKFAELKNCYPNPATPYTGANFKYFIDKVSDITFTLFSPLGHKRALAKYIAQPIGENSFHIDIDHTFSSGAYYLFMETETGTAKRKFWVIR